MTAKTAAPSNGAEIHAESPDPVAPEESPAAVTPAQPDALAALEAERAELKDRLMRSLAEMENLRRRSERDASDARTYAVTNFARDMLTVADNIRRALDSVPEGGADDDTVRTLIEGLELTERDLLKTLARHGVKLLEPLGQKFDPNMHQAMFEVPDDEVQSGTVVQVVQSGYAIGERVLRPALVGVAKSSPKPAASEDGSAT